MQHFNLWCIYTCEKFTLAYFNKLSNSETYKVNILPLPHHHTLQKTDINIFLLQIFTYKRFYLSTHYSKLFKKIKYNIHSYLSRPMFIN